jgi:hypothetical protein
MKKENFSLFSLIEIRFADPISSIGLSEKNIIIGTMMGRLTSLSLIDKKTTLLNELSPENITGIIFDDTGNYFYASIGDDEILKFESDSNNTNPLSKIKNYKNELIHSKKCENMFSLISKKYLMLIELAPQEEGDITINHYDAYCQLTNIENEQKINFNIKMTNYSIPLDFNGLFFVWVEFLSDKERNLCIKNVLDNNESSFKLGLDKNFGHISHCKIINDYNIFLVRDLNKCEIREINEKFTLIKSFKSIGDEVIAIDYFFKHEKTQNEFLNEKNFNLNKNDEILKVKSIPLTTGNLINKSSENDIMKECNNSNKDSSIHDIDKTFNGIIAILDIDGNVNFYENNIIRKKFNLYDIKEINQDQKKKMFFSMGYAYFIKCNQNFICVSTDHGCYVIKNKN